MQENKSARTTIDVVTLKTQLPDALRTELVEWWEGGLGGMKTVKCPEKI